MCMMFFIACGGSSNNDNPPTVSISITQTLSVNVDGTGTLSVTRTNTDDFALSVSPASGSGCTKSGNNAVTCTPTAVGTYTVTVTATADTSKSATATVTVRATVSGTYYLDNTFQLCFITFSSNNTFTTNCLNMSSGSYTVSGTTLSLNVPGFMTSNWTIIDSNTIRDWEGDYWRKGSSSSSIYSLIQSDIDSDGNYLEGSQSGCGRPRQDPLMQYELDGMPEPDDTDDANDIECELMQILKVVNLPSINN